MGRIPHDGDIVQNKRGIWYARLNGQRKTPNTPRAARDLLDEMRIDTQRPAIRPESQGDVIILRGVPGCGKTTWARDFMRKRSWYQRISRDDLRQMFRFGHYSPQQEKFIREMQAQLIMDVLKDDPHLVIDNTNLRERDVREIKSHCIGWWHGAPSISIEILEFHAPLEICIARDALRAEPVGAERIAEMHTRWQYECEAQSDEDRAIMAARIEELRLPPSWRMNED